MSSFPHEPDGKRAQLIAKFRDRETREGYAEGFLHTWISTQLTVVRQQRGLTQTQLAELVGTKQPGIARMESDGYGKWNMAKLVKAAHALGCRLKVSLESYGSLVDEAVAFRSPEYLLRPDFEEDPVFQEASVEEDDMCPEPIREMRLKMRRWFDANAPREQLKSWLQGYDLPPVGDEEPPAFWVMEGLGAAPPEEDKSILIRRVQSCLEESGEGYFREVPRQEDYQVNLFDVAGRMRQSRHFQDGLEKNHSRLEREKVPLVRAPAGLSLLEAMVLNQDSSQFKPYWFSRIQQHDPEMLYRNLRFGLRGMAWIPNAPSHHALAEGLQVAAETCLQKTWPLDAFKRSISRTFADVWREFREHPTFPDELCTQVTQKTGQVPEIVSNAMMRTFPMGYKAARSVDSDQFYGITTLAAIAG